MPYVPRKSYRNYTRSSTSSRYGTRTPSTTTKSRFSTKARTAKATHTALKRKATPGANRSLALNNKRKLNTLTSRLNGPHQTSTGTSPPIYVTNMQPACLHISNPNVGPEGDNTSKGPAWRRSDGTDVSTLNGHVNALPEVIGYEVKHVPLMANDNGRNVPTAEGPRCKLNGIDLQFKISGFLPDTRVKIMILQEKINHRSDPWRNHTSGDWTSREYPHYMPYCLNQFQNLVGFNANRLDYKRFKVLQQRNLYFNSVQTTPDSTMQDFAEYVTGTDVNSHEHVPATTKSVQYCHMKLRFNAKTLYQIRSTQAERNDSTTEDLDAVSNNQFVEGIYSFDNQNPAANLWCVICTDDEHSVLDNFDNMGGDTVRVECIRRVWWQDKARATSLD